mmetsp:Transcript_28740/g.89567  ORF Transcript_28740/g.89567 Transcript_28740/m.89567 type:complete len:364 (+) Transcript_28740:74-1165(+)
MEGVASEPNALQQARSPAPAHAVAPPTDAIVVRELHFGSPEESCSLLVEEEERAPSAARADPGGGADAEKEAPGGRWRAAGRRAAFGLLALAILASAVCHGAQKVGAAATAAVQAEDDLASTGTAARRIADSTHTSLRAVVGLAAQRALLDTKHAIFCDVGGLSGPEFADARKFDFDGSKLPEDGLTLSANIRSVVLGAYQVIMGWETTGGSPGSLELRLTAGGSLEYGEFAHTWSHVVAMPALNLADGNRHHVAAVRNASSLDVHAKGMQLLSLYVNGSLVGRGLVPHHVPAGLSAPAASARPRKHDFVFYGSVEHVRIFSEALGPAQLVELGSTECPPNLFDIEAGDIATAEDMELQGDEH